MESTREDVEKFAEAWTKLAEKNKFRFKAQG